MKHIISYLQNGIRKVPYFQVFMNSPFFPKNDMFVNEATRKRPIIVSKRLQSYIGSFSEYWIMEQID